MYWETYRAGLIKDGTSDGLPDPPACICTEFISFSWLELLYCSYKTSIPFLDEVLESESLSHIFFCN